MNILTGTVDVYLVLKNGTHDQILQMLGNEFIDLNGRYEVAGDTVYHAILRNKRLTEEQIIAISRIFRERGVDPATSNRHAKAPLYLAIENRTRDVADFFMTQNPRLPGIDYALTKFFVEDDNKQFWRLARENYAALKSWDSVKIEKESAKFLKWLIANDYHENSEEDFELIMLLHLAVDCNLKHILPVLLEHASERIISNTEHESLLQLYLKKHFLVKKVLYNYRSREWYSGYASRYTIRIVEILLDKGAVVDLPLVHLVVDEIRDIAVIKRMVDRLPNGGDEGIFARILDNLMRYPDDATASEHYRQTLSALVSKGANVNERKSNLVQVAMGAKNVQGVLWLNEAGADFSVLTWAEENLLHLLLDWPLVEASPELAIFDLLLSKGCQINAKNFLGLTPLHLAAKKNKVALVKKLIENNAEIDCRDNNKRTPLHYAVMRVDSIDMVEMLLENGANVNARYGKGGKDPLFLAVSTALRKCRMVEVLLERGAQVNALHYVRDKLALKYVVDRVGSTLISEFLKYGLEVKDSHFMRYIFARRPSIRKLMELHNIKLEAAAFPAGMISSFPDDKKQKYHAVFSKEIKVLKTTFIESRTSLYRLLHLGLDERRIHINNEKLKALVNSPALKKQFPIYAVLILANYREAVMRRSLLEPAKEAWLELTGIALPGICIERIFSYLSNMNLIDIIGVYN